MKNIEKERKELNVNNLIKNFIGVLTIFCLLAGCSSYNRKLKDSRVLGRYQTIYQKQQNFHVDSVSLQIELYSLETGKPLAFEGLKFSLNEYKNKIIKGNTCRTSFLRKEVPRSISIELYREKKFPMRILPVLKKRKNILYKVYLADDSRGII